MEKKIEDKIKELKKGDTVVVYSDYDKRVSPFEEIVKSIGKKQVTTGINCHNSKFDLMGYGSYGWNLFPGNMEEYNEWVETKIMAKNLLDKLTSKIYTLSKEELAIIEKMISE